MTEAEAVTAVPKVVARFARDAARGIGVEPEIFQPDPLLWRIRVKGAHIEASADFRVRLGGKVKYASGRLLVDGKERPLLQHDGLRALWDKLEDRTAARVRVKPLEPPPDGLAAPAEVTALHEKITAALTAAGEDAPVGIGYDAATGFWILGIDTGNGDGARFVFAPLGNGNWKLGSKTPIQVVSGGVDRSAGIGSDIGRALAALAGRYPGAEDKPPQQRRKTDRGARDQGTETRRRVVIRQ